MKEYAVVGSGIGGSTIAAYLTARGHGTVLFEKEPYLGGCSSTFEHGGYAYNTGATTLAGYQDGHIVKTIFDSIGFTPELIETDPAIVIIQNGKTVPRYRDLEPFLEALETLHPHPKNRVFWTLVYTISQQFHTMSGHYYSNRSKAAKFLSLASYLPIFFKFQRYLRVNARTFINTFFDGIPSDYLAFLEAQLFIVAQAHSKEVNFLTAALSLGYTFNATHYVPGGFGRLFDAMTASVKDVRRNTEVQRIERMPDHFLLHTKDGSLRAEKVILNSTVYESGRLFDDRFVKRYYEKYGRLNNHQSSFMLYMTIKSEKPFHHHYQLIGEQIYPHTLSNALFVSVSDRDDNALSPEGHYSITASIHTDSRWWEDKTVYRAQKNSVKALLLKKICATLDIKESEIVHLFAATPKTFRRYINRAQLGGNAITMKNFLPRLPGNDTPVQGLFHVGDTVYAAQGWPGVMLSVENLRRLLDV